MRNDCLCAVYSPQLARFCCNIVDRRDLSDTDVSDINTAIDMGAATGAAILLSNQEYWEIGHLEITSGAPTAKEHRQAVLVLGSGAGRVFRHIVVADCHIHDMWGLMGGRVQGVDSYTSTSILVASTRGEQVATFDDVLIEGNVIERVDRSASIL